MSERKGTKALELWCKRLIKDSPNVHIENMTSSWRNGIAFCALVNHFRPDLIDIAKLKPENIYENNQLAFNLAEKHLGIPALLDPEDMVENEVPDRLSILTYLSQFYQRLGHTVITKANESDSQLSSPTSSTQMNAALMFGKVVLDKCVVCGQSVYLAQRLIVSSKLYHRQCYCCSKCSTQLNPSNFNSKDSHSELTCDNCVNEGTNFKYLNNTETQMGMLAFTEPVVDEVDTEKSQLIPKRRSQSILDKISMFEKSSEENINVKLDNLTIMESFKDKVEASVASSSNIGSQCDVVKTDIDELVCSVEKTDSPNDLKRENSYKSDEKKLTFLQTQLSSCINDKEKQQSDSGIQELDNCVPSGEKEDEQNATDDNRLANSSMPDKDALPETKNDSETMVNVPPRRKKRVSLENNASKNDNMVENTQKDCTKKEYPVHLNPFSDDEEEKDISTSDKKHESTNPFGSSDEDEENTLNAQTEPQPNAAHQTTTSDTPQKRLISANPFWSDDEEPSSDEEKPHNNSSMYKSSIATSTPNLRVSTPRKKKAPAPPPPARGSEGLPSISATSTDDVASLSSMSSFNSTAHSDQKSLGNITPRLPKRSAPTPPDSLSTVSAGSRDLRAKTPSDRGDDSLVSVKKRPAPGLPLPASRRSVGGPPQEETAARLRLLEAQQLGLERQGVRLERLIRDKCEGNEVASVPQEEVEELVIQLCELVNEKNELFRQQTELMYIRRQQRLEQEQADIEHEIRVIQSRPAVNRIDADKVREEQLVSRLVELVRLRDELVQRADAERRRERDEDRAIAASIAARRAKRSSESNSSSMKSDVQAVATPKKNKVKDKMKKQFKKAKHSLIPKKKDDSPKESKGDKDDKTKGKSQISI